MKSINTLAARESAYRALKAAYPDADIQPVELRLERTLKNALNEYKFPLLLSDAIPLECEERLLSTDMILVTEIGLGIYERDRTLADASAKMLETSANLNAFTAGGATFNWKHLRRFWNGSLAIRRSTDQSIERMPTSWFYESPLTQQASATTNGSSAGDTSGRRQINPRLKIRGGEQTEIKLTFPAFASVKWEQDAANVDVQAVILLSGYVVKGVDGKKEISLY